MPRGLQERATLSTALYRSLQHSSKTAGVTWVTSLPAGVLPAGGHCAARARSDRFEAVRAGRTGILPARGPQTKGAQDGVVERPRDGIAKDPCGAVLWGRRPVLRPQRHSVSLRRVE